MAENINPNPRRSRSQKARILAYLQEGYTLTPLEALNLFGTTKLATRVSELISEGEMIYKRPERVTTKDGGSARVMQYYIPAM